MNNRAQELFRQGKYEEALELQRKVLAIKTKATGAESMQVALTLNAMGKCLLKLNQLNQAKEILIKAVKIRERTQGVDSSDARYSLENLALVYEHMGEYDECRRLRDNGNNHFCASDQCNSMGMYSKKLSACGGCRSIFYCCQRCQKSDWARHKQFCSKMKV